LRFAHPNDLHLTFWLSTLCGASQPVEKDKLLRVRRKRQRLRPHPLPQSDREVGHTAFEELTAVVGILIILPAEGIARLGRLALAHLPSSKFLAPMFDGVRTAWLASGRRLGAE